MARTILAYLGYLQLLLIHFAYPSTIFFFQILPLITQTFQALCGIHENGMICYEVLLYNSAVSQVRYIASVG